MTRGFYNLTSGIVSQGRRLDVVANNMTNLSTPGYKQQRYTDITFEEAMISRIGNKNKKDAVEIGEGSYILAPSQLYVDYTQGALDETGLNLDFAIDGDGFFAIQTENGVEYTRNGSFALDGEGYLYLPAHGRVLDANGQPIFLPTDDIRVNQNGEIFAQLDGEFFGQLGVYTFQDNEQLEIGVSGLFLANGQGATPIQTRVHWRTVELSNTNMLQEMTLMMTAQRALQSAAQVLKLYDGVLTKATNEIGRI